MTTSNSTALTTRERLKHCPVAQMLYDKTGGADGFPLAAVAVVAASDQSITMAHESVRSGEVTVKRFVKEFEKKALDAVVLAHLIRAEEDANVTKPMNPEAKAQLAKRIAQMMHDDDMSWNLADLRIVMGRLTSGECGPIYGGLTAQMVMKAFMDYMSEKCEAFCDLREEERGRYNGEWDRGIDRGTVSRRKADEREKYRSALASYTLEKMRNSKEEQP